VSVLETERLVLRHLTKSDAAFIQELVNDPDWLRYIGNKNVHSSEDAVRYLREGPLEMYRRHGHGFYAMQLKPRGESIGICGLIRREGLEEVDLCFAVLPSYRRQGYATEAAAATLEYAKQVMKLKRVLAITTPDNPVSARLLEKLGMRLEKRITLGGEELDLYSTRP
jgi:[ribosomal protein S5]-alanine N-acetyltransferase